jgi:hypothetical protein
METENSSEMLGKNISLHSHNVMTQSTGLFIFEKEDAQGILCRRQQVHISNGYRQTKLKAFSNICLKTGASVHLCTNGLIVLNFISFPDVRDSFIFETPDSHSGP